MKIVFGIILGILLVLSLIAWGLKPSRARDGALTLVWVTDPNPTRDEQCEMFAEMFADRGLRVEVDPNNSGVGKVIVQTTAGIGPDLIDIYDVAQFRAYLQAGVLYDVTDYAREHGLTPEICWPACRDLMVFEGRQYTFPTNCGTWFIFYNKRIFDRYGVPYPDGDWDWEEFAEVAEKLTRKREDGRGYATFGAMGLDLLESIYQNRGRIYTPDGTRCVLDSPEAIEAAEWLADLRFRRHVMPTAAEELAMSAQGGWGRGLINLFEAGKVAMIRYGRWGLVRWRVAQPPEDSLAPSLKDIGVVAMPRGKEKVTLFVMRATGINRKSPYRDQARTFHEFLASQPYCEQINRSADAIAAVMEYCYTDTFLKNPEYPEEDYNQIFLDENLNARNIEVSPFLDPSEFDRIFRRYADQITVGSKPPAEAMRDLARSVNDAIRDNIERRPELKKRYEELTGS